MDDATASRMNRATMLFIAKSFSSATTITAIRPSVPCTAFEVGMDAIKASGSTTATQISARPISLGLSFRVAIKSAI